MITHLVQLEKPAQKGTLKLNVSKKVLMEYEAEIEIFKQLNKDNATLNFDNLVLKLVNEIKKINKIGK